MMNRYYMHEFSINGAILIDTKEKTWTFYNTNIYNQIYNLDEQPKKITKQRINGLIKRLQRYPDPYSSYVVDQYIYNYIMSEEQRDKCRYPAELKDELIASGNDLKKILTNTCKYFLDRDDKAMTDNTDYYVSIIEKVVS